MNSNVCWFRERVGRKGLLRVRKVPGGVMAVFIDPPRPVEDEFYLGEIAPHRNIVPIHDEEELTLLNLAYPVD